MMSLNVTMESASPRPGYVTGMMTVVTRQMNQTIAVSISRP